MRRRIVALAAISVVVMLAALGCSSAPPAAKEPVAKAPAAKRATTPRQGFTVFGDHPVSANGSQDTRAQAAGIACDVDQLADDRALGRQIAAGFSTEDFTVSAELLRHFLAGSGKGVNYPPSSAIARLALASGQFAKLRGEVTTAIMRQLAAGKSRVRLAAGQLPLATFSSASSDLYWGFRGTQGLTVTGSGVRKGGRYVGTISYVIRDSYGFPVGDTLGGFGAPMRYLQTACGAPQHAGGAHWFPDSITVTVPFSQPALGMRTCPGWRRVAAGRCRRAGSAVRRP